MVQEPVRMVWRVHPAAERRGVALLVISLILILSILAGFWMQGNFYWSLFAFVVLFLSLEAFFLPSRFELDASGVTVKKPFSRVVRPWDHFRRVGFDRVGITLSPFRRRHWLDSYRSVRLRLSRASGGPTPAEVRGFILAHVDTASVRIEGAEDSRATPAGSGEVADGTD